MFYMCLYIYTWILLLKVIINNVMFIKFNLLALSMRAYMLLPLFL